MKTVFKFIFLTLFFALIGAVIWFFNSQQGLTWTFDRLSNISEFNIEVDSVRGSLAGPIEINKVSIKHSDVDLKVDTLKLDWNLFRLLSFELDTKLLYAENVIINLKSKSNTVTDNSTQTNIDLPIDLLFSQIHFKNITLLKDNIQSLAVDNLETEIQLIKNNILVKSFNLNAPLGNVTTKGSVKPNEKFNMKLATQWKFIYQKNEIFGEGNFIGDFEELAINQSLTGAIKLYLYAKVNDVIGSPTWDIKSIVSTLDLGNLLPDYNFRIHDSQIESKGNIQDFNVKSHLNVNDMKKIQLQSDFDLDFTNQTWNINKMKILHKTNNSTFNVSGLIRLSDGLFGKLTKSKLNGNWEKLVWPLEGPSSVVSESGNFNVVGNLEKYVFGVNGIVSYDNVTYGTWNTNGAGDANEVNIEFNNASIFEGKINGAGKFSWQHGLLWDYDIQSAELNPATMWPQWPGKVNLSLKISGSWIDNKLLSNIDLAGLKGKLRNFPLSGSGNLQIDDNKYTIAKLNVKSGSAKVNVSGQFGQQNDLQWDLKASDLKELLPELVGSAKIKGSFKGQLNKPIINSTISAKNLNFNSMSAQKLYSDIRIKPNDNLESKVSVKMYDVVLGDERFDRINLEAKGDQKNLILSLIASGKGKDVLVNTVAGMRDKLWFGKIEKANLNHSKYSSWYLQKPIEYQFGADMFRFRNGCWKVGSGNVCGDFDWKGSSGFTGNINIKNFQTNDLKLVMPSGVVMEGGFSADVDFEYSNTKHLLGKADINFTTGNIKYQQPDSNVITFDYDNAKAHFSAKQDTIAGSINIDSNTFGKTRGYIDVPFWNEEKSIFDQEVSGRFTINADRIDYLENFVSEINSVKGKIISNITVNGQLKAPSVTVDVTLNDGSFEIPRLGMQVSEVKLKSLKTKNSDIQIEGSAKSGKGTLLVDGNIEIEKNKINAVTLGLHGKNFQAVNRSDLNLEVSPELQCIIVKNRIDLVGDVTITNTVIRPPDTADTITESDDVVLLGEIKEESTNGKWDIHTGIKFIFGENVKFYGFGLDGGISGQIVVLDEPKQLTSSYGELNIVDGTYKTYDEVLKIVKGRLIFTGGPVNNPGVDVNAERTIGDIMVGINVRGTLMDPQMTLYSKPTMDQTDILAYLILGVAGIDASNDKAKLNLLYLAASTLKITGGESLSNRIANKFGLQELGLAIQDVKTEDNENSKQLSLVLGKYLTPRLYINYSVGSTFNSEFSNTFRLQYKLSKKWTLQSEQGNNDTAADLIFSLEK